MPDRTTENNTRRKTTRNIIIGGIAVVAAVIIIASIFYQNSIKQQFAPNKQHTPAPRGVCMPKLPDPVIDSNYIKIVATLKGASLQLRYFEWNRLDYVNNPANCYKANKAADGGSVTTYVPRKKTDSIIPIYAMIRTTAVDNDYEFSVKAFDLHDSLIGKYPAGSETHKGKILSLNDKEELNDIVKLKD